MTLITQTSLAYVNHGRWIAECPRPYCNNAIALKPRQPEFFCWGDGGCQMVATIVWPDNVEDIQEALMRRPVPSTRNWFPVGHPMAEQMNLPMGQTPRELLDEQEEMERLG